MSAFHTDEYIDFLSRVSPDNMESYAKEQVKCMALFFFLFLLILGLSLVLDLFGLIGLTYRFSLSILLSKTIVNVGDDCPIFEGLFEYCQLSAGGSMGMSSTLLPLTSRRSGDAASRCSLGNEPLT